MMKDRPPECHTESSSGRALECLLIRLHHRLDHMVVGVSGPGALGQREENRRRHSEDGAEPSLIFHG